MICGSHVNDATAFDIRYFTYLDRHRHEPHLLAVAWPRWLKGGEHG